MSISDFAERVRARLMRRRDAYRAVFLQAGTPDLHPQADIVLHDLARYCHVDRTSLRVSPITGAADPLALAFAEGRRDVFNRIVAQCHLTNEQVTRTAYSKETD
jgi:hypothetical protein